ncbi:hypothetical protein [Fibrella aquatica]|uniref:hypothetical protein n=1 Tax=Fibrella aquatica TaxID=3242487 RepID=UPI0035208236
MKNYSMLQLAKKRLAIGLSMALVGISTLADAKAYSCSCSYSEGNSSYSFDYVASGSGCCSGETGAGSALYSKKTGSQTETGYTEPRFAQSMCCNVH